MSPATARWIFILLAVFAMSALTPTPADATGFQSFSPSMPMHGNWCGPNHPSNPLEASYPPIDPLDEACRQHDVCIAAKGTGDCGCDIAFMNTLKRMPYPTPGLEEKARALYDAIGLTPCSNPFGMAYKQRCVWGDLAADTVTGRRTPWQMPLRFGKLGLTVLENKLNRGW